MTFKLGDVAKLSGPFIRFECPTGKHAFARKQDASREADRINRTQRTRMRAFRCGYCEQYHLGHARGRIL